MLPLLNRNMIKEGRHLGGLVLESRGKSPNLAPLLQRL